MEQLTPEDPDRIGPYRLLGRLGEGGMGTVYLGRSDRGRTVAVKTILTTLARDPEFRRRFAREIAAARRVGGEWTAPVLDADTEAEHPWVATAFIAGPSLLQVVSEHGTLPAPSALLLAGGMARALGAVHAAGVLHRDLKPSNVLLTFDGPRVIDFGIARALDPAPGDRITRTGTVVGSPGFMSPEQVDGGRLTPASDVFGLGSLLTYAVTGRTPFGALDTSPHLLTYRIAHQPPELDGVPEELRELIGGCLAKDPTLRTPLAQLLGHPAPDGRPWLPPEVVQGIGRTAEALLALEHAHPTRPPMPAPPTAVAPERPEAPPTVPVSVPSPPDARRPSPAPRGRRGLAVALAGAVVVAVLGLAAAVTLADDDGDDAAGGDGAENAATPPSAPVAVPEGLLGSWQGEYGTEGEPGWKALWLEIRQARPGESVGRAIVTYRSSMCVYDIRLESLREDRLDYTEVAERSVPEGELEENCRADGTVRSLSLLPDGELRWSGGEQEASLERAETGDQGAVPAALVRSWRDEYTTDDDEEGLDEVTIEQGAIGDTVWRWTWQLDGETCVTENQLAAVRGDELLLSPDILIEERSDDTCRAQNSSWVRTGPDGTLYIQWTSSPDDEPYPVEND
ncbi:serine/threonine-protein kinase [Streptomyces sp. 8K308]|uniref:serine/threonine-protein kinase n=1 Tax=Streptomyces sp. 8K308 TaxID=2530388 RepID=UPI001FB5FECA|nr:serine/threonine-protein kinase [Streptomyces sp. 8K308]